MARGAVQPCVRGGQGWAPWPLPDSPALPSQRPSPPPRIALPRSIHLRVYSAEFPGSPNLRYKGVCDLPFAPEVVYATLSNNARRIVWDRNILSLDATLCVCALCAQPRRSPPPSSPFRIIP